MTFNLAITGMCRPYAYLPNGQHDNCLGRKCLITTATRHIGVWGGFIGIDQCGYGFGFERALHHAVGIHTKPKLCVCGAVQQKGENLTVNVVSQVVLLRYIRNRNAAYRQQHQING